MTPFNSFVQFVFFAFSHSGEGFMKKALISIAIALLSVSVFAQTEPGVLFDLTSYGVRIEPDKRLIAVLATLEVAGMDTPLTARGEDLRRSLEADSRSIDPQLRQKIKIFVNQYRKRHKEATSFELIAPYVSMAYSLTAAPDLAEPFRSLDLPDDLLEVLDFSVLVREYYKSPGIAQKIDAYFKSYQALSDELRPSAREMVTDVLDYMHTRPQLTFVERVKVETKKGRQTLTTYEPRERERTFRIVPEILAAKGTINFLNIRDDYYAIVPPETDLSSSEVRRAYLRFVLDPLVLRYSKEVREKQKAIKELITKRRDAGGTVSVDPFLTLSRSLVAAVDSREEQYRKQRLATVQARRKILLMKTDTEKRAVAAELDRVSAILEDEAALQLSESYERGAVLCFYFAENLKGIEDSGFDIASSVRDWIRSLDPLKETARLQQFASARQRAAAQREKGATKLVIETTLVENPLTAKLLEIDKLTEAGRFAEAETALKALVKSAPSESARIYYALGRVSSRSAEGVKDRNELNTRLLKAKVFYENVLRSSTAETDPGLISSTYFALGRIYEYYNNADYAVKIYDAALKMGRVEGGAFEQAFEAKQAILAKTKPKQ